MRLSWHYCHPVSGAGTMPSQDNQWPVGRGPGTEGQMSRSACMSAGHGHVKARGSAGCVSRFGAQACWEMPLCSQQVA